MICCNAKQGIDRLFTKNKAKTIIHTFFLLLELLINRMLIYLIVCLFGKLWIRPKKGLLGS